MKKRTCTKCGKISEDHAFATFRYRDGRIGRRNVCLECRAKYHQENFDRLQKYRKEYNKKNRTRKAIESAKRREESKAIVNKIKEENPCADCGGYFPAVAMDFDHVEPKAKGIANMVSQGYSPKLILEEIKKCELVCACCHRIRTAKRKENLSPCRKK